MSGSILRYLNTSGLLMLKFGTLVSITFPSLTTCSVLFLLIFLITGYTQSDTYRPLMVSILCLVECNGQSSRSEYGHQYFRPPVNRLSIGN